MIKQSGVKDLMSDDYIKRFLNLEYNVIVHNDMYPKIYELYNTYERVTDKYLNIPIYRRVSMDTRIRYGSVEFFMSNIDYQDEFNDMCRKINDTVKNRKTYRDNNIPE